MIANPVNAGQARVPTVESSRTRVPVLAVDRSFIFAGACGDLFSTRGAG